MREIRLSGSEGGGTVNPSFLPLSCRADALVGPLSVLPRLGTMLWSVTCRASKRSQRWTMPRLQIS